MIGHANKGDPMVMREQAEAYYREGYAADLPMISANVLIRSHKDPVLHAAMETWWQEFNTRSQKEQMSFCYACWKNRVDYDLCELQIFDNPYLLVTEHVGRGSV